MPILKSKYVLSGDLAGSSKEKLIKDGWEVLTDSDIVFGENGIKGDGTGAVRCKKKIDYDITKAHRIIIKNVNYYESVYTSSNDLQYSYIGLVSEATATGGSDGTSSLEWADASTQGQSGYNILGVKTSFTTRAKLQGEECESIMELNFDEKTVSYTVNIGTDTFTETVSITDTEITQLKQLKYLYLFSNAPTNKTSGNCIKYYAVSFDELDIKAIYSGERVVNSVYLGDQKVRPQSYPSNFRYSDENREEYKSLVNSTGSVQFQSTGKSFRFNYGCYIGNRIAVDVDGSTFRKINLDTLKVISSKSCSVDGRIRYFGDNRILTSSGIMDFDGNMITKFSTTYTSIVVGLPGVVWANNGYNIYKGVVDGDNITFTKIGTASKDQFAGEMSYGRSGAYLINDNDTTGDGYSAYINPSTNAISNFKGGDHSRTERAVSGPDGKLYRQACRYNGRGRLQKIGTGDEGLVGNSLSTGWLAYGNRFGKFLGNIVSGGMSSSRGTGNGYGSNNYFISTSGDLSLVQSNAFPFDSSVHALYGFIDENGWIYPRTFEGGSGTIIKTDKTFKNLSWRNPYLWR